RVSFGENLSLRLYCACTAVADGTQTIVKIATTIFSSLLAAVYLGRSKILNEWSAAHIKDMTVAAMMTWYSAKGIFLPKSSTESRDALVDSQGVHELGNFKVKVIDKMNLFEKFTVRLEFIINVVKEIFDIAISGVRYGISCLFKKVHQNSQMFDGISYYEFLLLSKHTGYLFDSCEGVVRPKEANLKMVKP
ncbi:MAG: hypothetical protein AAGG81_09365, partial [Chlamydiota bacterium]